MKRRALLFFLLVNVLLISCSKNKSSKEDSHFLIFGFEKSKQDSLIHLEGNYIYSDDLDNSNVLVSYVEPFLSKEINRCVVFVRMDIICSSQKMNLKNGREINVIWRMNVCLFLYPYLMKMVE